MDDIFGQALKDYTNGDESPLILHNSYGESEEMPIWYLFREFIDMPELEKMALSICEGHVLDVGAGTGAHSLVLQQSGHSVTAIDISAGAIEIMNKSGVLNTMKTGFLDYNEQKYDTILLLMNGIGVVGVLNRLEEFLNHTKQLLNSEGQLVFDSSDISYLYEKDGLPPHHYYGEVKFQYEYKGKKGEWFDWLYIDPDTLSEKADSAGWYTYFLHQDDQDQYLVRMIPK